MSLDEHIFLTRRQWRQKQGLTRFVVVTREGEKVEATHTGGQRLNAPAPWGVDTTYTAAYWGGVAPTAQPEKEDDGYVSPFDEDDTPVVLPTWDDDDPADATDLTPGAGAEEPAAVEDVVLDDPLPEPPAFFQRLRIALARMFGRQSPAVELAPEPAPDDAVAWKLDTDGEPLPETVWVPAATPELEEQGEPEPEPLTAKERRARKKAAAQQKADDARAAKVEAAEAKAQQKLATAEEKRQAKLDSLSELKRQQNQAKADKLLAKRREREALENEKVEDDEARSRSKRERKAQAEWRKKQKRRDAIRLNGGKEGFWQGTNKPKPMEVANSIRALAITLETSPAEIDAVKMMAEEFAGNRIGDGFDRIHERLVKDNMTLVEAFAPEEVFPPVVHNMLRVGAKTAKPGPALRTAVDLMNAGNNSKRTMRNALREPLIVAALSLGILFATAYFVMPTFIDMYDSLDMQVGMFTAITVVISDVAMWAIGIGAVLAALLSIWWFAQGRSSMRVRIAIDRFKLHAPLVGISEQTTEVFQMFNILGAYLAVGATERESLLDTAAAVENRAIKRHLRATANGLTRGEKSFAQFLDDDMFPRLARSILATGQRNGQTTQVVKHLRDIYEEEARVESEQAVAKVVGLVSGISSLVFTATAFIVSIPPLEIFGATLSFDG